MARDAAIRSKSRFRKNSAFCGERHRGRERKKEKFMPTIAILKRGLTNGVQYCEVAEHLRRLFQ